MTSPAEPASPGNAAGGKGEAPPPRRRKRRRRALTETVIAIVVALLLALGLRSFVFQTFYIPTSSMVPTLAVGDRILVLKACVNWRAVHPGEIIVLNHPPRDQCGGPAEGDLVKRVIGLPGQT